MSTKESPSLSLSSYQTYYFGHNSSKEQNKTSYFSVTYTLPSFGRKTQSSNKQLHGKTKKIPSCTQEKIKRKQISRDKKQRDVLTFGRENASRDIFRSRFDIQSHCSGSGRSRGRGSILMKTRGPTFQNPRTPSLTQCS